MPKPVDTFIKENVLPIPSPPPVRTEFWRGVDRAPVVVPEAPTLSPSEKAARKAASNQKGWKTPDGHFCCSACGAKVVRPADVSANDWAQRRRCDPCVAANRQPPEGKRHCRHCGKLFTVRGCERFDRYHRPKR